MAPAAPKPVAATKTARFAAYLWRERLLAVLSALDVVDTAFVSRALARSPTRVVLTIRTHLSSQFADRPDRGLAHVRRALVRLRYPRTERLIAVSRGVADDAERIAHLPRGRVDVIPSPVVASDLAERAREPVDHPFLPGELPVILGIRRLVRQKDFSTLIEAFAPVCEQRPARLIILGDRDTREPEVLLALDAAIQRHGLELPTVLIEALAVGTRIVATDCDSGLREILDASRHGTLVPVNDRRALADGIVGALETRHDVQALRARAQHYSVEAVISDQLRVIGA